jgi:LysR family transcriptional regulator, carnitine catabolism transcriptional activator
MDLLDSPSNLTLRQLRAFWLVSHEGSMTRAATHMHLTISALSMLVRTLEDELGVRLFERTTRRVELTEAGRQFLPTVRDVFFVLDAGLETLQESKRRKSERLSVVTSPLLAASLVPVVIAQFRAQFPNVVVTLQDAPVDQVVARVREGKSDFGICTADLESGDLVSQVLYKDTLVLACSPDHALAGQREAGWGDLIDQNLILLNAGTGLRRLVDQTLGQLTLRVKPAFEVANIQTAVGLVAAGLGVSVLPAYSLLRVDGARVAAVPLTDPVVTREIVALCTRARPFSMAAEAFLKLFKKYAAQNTV